MVWTASFYFPPQAIRNNLGEPASFIRPSHLEGAAHVLLSIHLNGHKTIQSTAKMH